MKILHYIPSIGRSGGGVSAYLQLLSCSLGKLVELHIVCHPSTDVLELENCHVHFIEGSIKRLFKMRRQYDALLDELKPDVVHVNGCWMLQCSCTVFWARAKGYPVVISPHGMLEPWDIAKNYWTKKLPALLLYQKRSIKSCQMLVATSESEMRNLKNLGYNENIVVVPNGIAINGIEMKNSWEERKQILFLALFRRNKGIDLLMQAVSRMKTELEGWRVTVAGIESDYTVKELEAMACEWGIADMVTVVNGLFGEKKWNAYRHADVFVLPTLNENFGIVIAEAFICGTPVITTKGAPWPEIPEYQCGWWIERTVEELVGALREFIHTPVAVRRQMGMSGRRLVEDFFASDSVAEKMVRVYERVLG